MVGYISIVQSPPYATRCQNSFKNVATLYLQYSQWIQIPLLLWAGFSWFSCLPLLNVKTFGRNISLSISIKLSFSRASLILRFSWKKSLLFTENSRYPSVLKAIWHVCINILKLYLIILSIHIQLGTLLKNFGKDSSSSKKISKLLRK